MNYGRLFLSDSLAISLKGRDDDPASELGSTTYLWGVLDSADVRGGVVERLLRLRGADCRC